MVPDLATWQIRVGGVLLFGASERPLNDPGVDLDDPMVPMLEDGAHRDGQIPPFYVKCQNLTVPMCTTLRFWTPRIGHIDPRVVQGPFRCSKNHATSYTDLPFGKIGHHMGQNDALAIAWGALFRNGAGAYTKCIELASRGEDPARGARERRPECERGVRAMSLSDESER